MLEVPVCHPSFFTEHNFQVARTSSVVVFVFCVPSFLCDDGAWRMRRGSMHESSGDVASSLFFMFMHNHFFRNIHTQPPFVRRRKDIVCSNRTHEATERVHERTRPVGGSLCEVRGRRSDECLRESGCRNPLVQNLVSSGAHHFSMQPAATES